MFKIFFRKRIFRKRVVSRGWKMKKISVFDGIEFKKFSKKVRSRIEHFKAFYYERGYNMNYNTVAVRNQKSRWGSCSSKKNLNFNFKMRTLSEDLFDYIIVHELCHLIHMNHAPEFWKLVSVAVPDYKEKRGRLKSMRI